MLLLSLMVFVNDFVHTFSPTTDRKVKQSISKQGSALCANPILRLNFLPPALRISQIRELNVGHSVVLSDQDCWNMISDFQQHFLKWTSLAACTCLWWSRCLDHNTLGSHSVARYFDQSCWSRELCLFAFDVQRGQFSCPKACSVVFTFCLLVDLQAHRFLTHKNEWEFHSDLQADITG